MDVHKYSEGRQGEETDVRTMRFKKNLTQTENKWRKKTKQKQIPTVLMISNNFTKSQLDSAEGVLMIMMTDSNYVWK